MELAKYYIIIDVKGKFYNIKNIQEIGKKSYCLKKFDIVT